MSLTTTFSEWVFAVAQAAPAVVNSGNETALFWGLGLLAASLLLVIIEVFVPSGGLISVLSFGCAVGGVYFLFQHSTTWGLAGILAVLVLGPSAFAFALKIWPSTPIGKAMLGAKTEQQVEAERLEQLTERRAIESLIGAEGVVRTDLRPVGVVEIGGQRYNALSETSLVRAGTRVRVTHADGSQIKVRPV